MSKESRQTLDQISSEDGYKIANAEFKGMVIQSLKDIREDINEIKEQNNVTRWISFGIAGLAGIVSSIMGKDIKL